MAHLVADRPADRRRVLKASIEEEDRDLNADVETIFMLPAVEYTYVSSRLVKEVFRLGGDVERLVPPAVLESLKARLPVTV